MATAISITAPPTSTASSAGTFSLSASISCPNTAFAVQTYFFPSATQLAITSPNGAQVAIIVPNPANTTALTFQGVSADVGISISPSQPTGPITFASTSGTNTFYLTSNAATTGNVQVIFY